MIRLRHKLLIRVSRVLDQVTLVLTAAYVFYIHPQANRQGWTHALDGTFTLVDVKIALILVAGWLVIFDYFIRYKSDRLVAISTQVKNFLLASVSASMFLMVVLAVLSKESPEIRAVLAFVVLVTIIGVLGRYLLRIVVLTARTSGYNYRFVLFVGWNERAWEIARKITLKKELGYKIVGFVVDEPASRGKWDMGNSENWKIVGMLGNLQTILAEQRVDEIIVCLPIDARFCDISMIVQLARDLGIVVRLMPNLSDGKILKNMYVEEFDDEYVVTLFREQLLIQLFMKRLIDAVVSLSVLVCFLPLMVIVAILIKLTSPGPVFFSQERVGMNQRQFRLHKFRSMVPDAENQVVALQHLNERDGPAFKIEKDPRITWIGRFLRKTSIDELPQMLNVLSGEMSLVGPRPPLPEEVSRYEWLFRKRLSVKPGVTCIWQVSGRNNISFDRWMEMDHEYIENWSLWLDIKILIQTIPAVIFSRGAS